MTGRAYLEDFGIVQGPIGISDTNAVGQVYAGIQQWSAKNFGEATWPVVAETWSGYLSDIEGFHVTAETRAGGARRGQGRGRSRKAMSAAGPAWSASASRAASAPRRASCRSTARRYTVGVLVQCNTGDRKVLRIAGAPVGPAFAQALAAMLRPQARATAAAAR